MRAAILAGLVLAAVGCGGPKEATKPAESPAKAVPVPVAKGKPKEPPAKKEEAPEPKAPPTFAEAWRLAQEAAGQLDRGEPGQTRAAVAILTAREKMTAEFEMGMSPPRLDYAAPVLIRLGLRAWVERAGRRVAQTDERFKGIAEALWDGTDAPDGIVRAMSAWGALSAAERINVADAVRAGTPTARLQSSTRDAILLLGGRKWLAR